MTAVIRDDQFGRLKELLSSQSPVVTFEYVLSPSTQHDDHLRVGVDLRMTPEQYSEAWWRFLWNPYSMVLMIMAFVAGAFPVGALMLVAFRF